MGVEEVLAIISTVGFPILCCIYMAWYINKMDEQYKESQHQLTSIIENNTKVMTQLIDKLDDLEGRLDILSISGGDLCGHK